MAAPDCGAPNGNPIAEPTRAAGSASSETTKPAERVFEAEYARVWKAVLQVLADRNESIAAQDERDGSVLTSKINVGRERLEQIADTGGRTFEQGGWFTLTFRLTRRSERETKVVLEPFIVGTDPARDNVWGGVPLKSRNVLESEVFPAITRQLTSP